jgi:hypothetical protein
MGIHHHPGLAGPYFWPAVITRLVILALFFLVPWIIALAYVWRDAWRRGQPGWLWALVGIFLGWLGILAYLIVRAFTPLASSTIVPSVPNRPYSPIPPPTGGPPTPTFEAQPPAE